MECAIIGRATSCAAGRPTSCFSSITPAARDRESSEPAGSSGRPTPAPNALDPRSPYLDARASTVKNPWSAVDVEFVEAFAGIIDLACLRSAPGLAKLPLLQKGSRLSVMPVDAGEWAAVLALR